jgi:cysteine synthase A
LSERNEIKLSRIYTKAEELIGKTPLLSLEATAMQLGTPSKILAKLELFNPGGSVKDRVAKEMLDAAERDGKLAPDTVIIEPTSGNTGIGLASVGVRRGYRVIIVMPDSYSQERRTLMSAFGAELVLTDGALGMAGAIAKAKELAKEFDSAFIPDQFSNFANADAHYKTTAPELWEDTDGNIDYFVAGVGTGGTLTGCARFLKEKNPNIKIIAVEPANSAVLSGKNAGKHGLQGIGAGFIPDVLDASLIDEVITVTDEEAYAAARQLGRCEGVLAGISAGAALHAAKLVALREDCMTEQKNIAVIIPDTGDRYLSTALFSH